MSDITVTNPGLVNVANQGDGLTKINQENPSRPLDQSRKTRPGGQACPRQAGG